MAEYVKKEDLISAFQSIMTDVTCPIHIAAEIDMILNQASTIDDEDWFGVVRWCNEDIESTLKEKGYAQTQGNINMVREALGSDFREAMTQAGWDHIDYVVDYLADDLTEEE